MNENIQRIIEKIEAGIFPSTAEWHTLLLCSGPEEDRYLAMRADAVRRKIYGKDIYLRGLIEFTNYCKNDCYYCGIRKSCSGILRYRLTPAEILECCETGYALGLRTFVLQGGEDPYWSDDRLETLVKTMRKDYPDCAITLSLGERSKSSYQCLYDAGANRYLLRHETANQAHYETLHPAEMSFAHRRKCLEDLKDIGYQVGCGFMVGSPGQTTGHIIEDLRFIKQFSPHMVGIGPFLPAKDTPFADEPAGSSALTVRLLSVLRLLFPKVLLPATTALGTVSRDGRLRGIKAGANVIMPNLTPKACREKYCIYDNKTISVPETAEGIALLKKEITDAGFRAVSQRGDYPDL